MNLTEAECHRKLYIKNVEDSVYKNQLHERGIYAGVNILKCCKGFTVIFNIGNTKLALQEDACKTIIVDYCDV